MWNTGGMWQGTAVIPGNVTVGGQILAANGTAALPSSSYTNAPTIGWYLSSDNGRIVASNSGVARVAIATAHFVVGSTTSIGWASGGADTSAAPDTRMARAAADSIAFGAATTGYRTNLTFTAEAHTLTAASTSDTATIIPANCRLVGVSGRVTTEITGCTSLTIGTTVTANLFGTGVALTAGTTFTLSPTAFANFAAATAIRFTAVGGGASFTAGVVRVVAHYETLTAPTS